MPHRLYENELEKREQQLIIKSNTKIMLVRRKGEAPKRFKTLKNVVRKDEQIALKKACEKLNTTPKGLITAHTETCFIFIEK